MEELSGRVVTETHIKNGFSGYWKDSGFCSGSAGKTLRILIGDPVIGSDIRYCLDQGSRDENDKNGLDFRYI